MKRASTSYVEETMSPTISMTVSDVISQSRNDGRADSFRVIHRSGTRPTKNPA